MSLRVGIVGMSGYYAVAFAEALWNNHRASFVAASTWPAEEERGVLLGQVPPLGGSSRGITLEEYERNFQVRMYDDPLTMITTENLDGICICGNTLDTRDQVEEIAPTGVHIFFQKPMCDTIEDASDILKSVRRYGVHTGACNPARYDEAIRQTKALSDAGELGKVMGVRAHLSHGGTRTDKVLDTVQMKGPEIHLGFYTADLILWFMDWSPVGTAFAHYAKLNTDDAQPTDIAKGVVRFRDGRIGSMDLYCSAQWPGPLWEVEIMGTDGFARTSQSVSQGTLFTRSGAHSFQHDHDHARRVHFAELDAWLTAVSSNRDCELSADRAARGIELCVAWKRSSDDRCQVEFPVASSS